MSQEERRDGRRRQRLRRRDRSGKVIAALRTGGYSPIDARCRYAVYDDGFTRLTSGDIIHRVMPVSGNGYERDVSRRRAPGQNRKDRNQCAQDRRVISSLRFTLFEITGVAARDLPHTPTQSGKHQPVNAPGRILGYRCFFPFFGISQSFRYTSPAKMVTVCWCVA